jgi:hypothetical protein
VLPVEGDQDEEPNRYYYGPEEGGDGAVDGDVVVGPLPWGISEQHLCCFQPS